MLKKSLLSLAVSASVLGLAGCNISSTTDNSGATPDLQVQQQAAMEAYGNYPLFDPVNSVLPVGIDLIFAAASDTDGTANVGATGGNPVFEAINDMDGVSTLASIDLAISGSVDPATVLAGDSVYLVRLPNAADAATWTLPDGLSGDDIEALDLATIGYYFSPLQPDGSAPTAPGQTVAELNTANFVASQPVADSDYEVSVISLDGGTNNTIRISPATPLDPKTKYVVVVTDEVTDASGTALKPSPDYALIKSATDSDGNLTATASQLAASSLVDVSKAINGWEKLATAYISGITGGAVTADNVVLSSAFTTTDPTTVLGAMTAPAAALPSALNPGLAVSSAIEPQPRNFEFIPVTGNQISIKTLTYNAETEESSIPYDVLISQGAIELPQYTLAFGPTTSDDIWEALDTPATPQDTDGSANVTYRFPFAKEKSSAVVPVLMFEPAGSGTSAACTGGQPWPVVILQHGFTSSRTGNLINGSKIANESCHAVIAIDLPHHGIAPNAGTQLAFNVEQANGAATPWATTVDAVIAANAETPENTILDDLKERHAGLYLDSSAGVLPMDFDNQAGDSGSLFIRLDNFQRTRDNMRQSVMDLMNLNASLENIDIDGDGTTDDLDLTDVNFIGHSLGAIVGTPFVALNNASLAANTNLNLIQSAVLATPGGHMSKLVENSAGLSSKIYAGLAAANASLAPGKSALESYMKVFQSILDSADPLNFTAALKSVNAGLGTPILFVGMYGDAESGIPSDLVVPVSGDAPVYPTGAAKAPSAVSPMAGLQPMLDILGAENVTGTPTGNIYLAKYNAGGHGTFSSAGEDDDPTSFDSEPAHTEMTNQNVDLLDDGAMDAGKNAAVLIAD